MFQVTPQRIFIVDDHPAILKGMTFALNGEWPACDLKTYRSGPDAIQEYLLLKPDIVLLDYQMPKVNGYETALELLRIDPKVKILLFTFLDSLDVAANFLAIGVRGFITKDASLDITFEAITSIIKGGHFFHSRYDKQLSEILVKGINTNLPKIQFTPRELEICLKLSKGLTAKMIAHDLNLSIRTIESHKDNLMKKTRVKNTVELIDFVYRNGIKPL
ncbi:MAG: response regulator transcription factor [Cyclobacteriaceae bacterium]|nr:response regulator transcription factor [Cyclobacteriaceae bacterium]